MQIRVSKRGGKRRTWLFGDRKENRVSASSGIAKRGVKEYWTIYMRKNKKTKTRGIINA
jgi:hypothetical protein